MFDSRRRRHAWLLALVLLTELALLCCASIHLGAHDCPGCEHCPICACVRSGRNRAAIAPLPALAAAGVVALSALVSLRRISHSSSTLFDLKVRFND